MRAAAAGHRARPYRPRRVSRAARLTLGHGVWLAEADLDRGTDICHNCSSNFRLRSGVAPLSAFEKRGINTAIGLDEAGINDDRDMLHRRWHGVAHPPGAGDGK